MEGKALLIGLFMILVVVVVAVAAFYFAAEDTGGTGSGTQYKVVCDVVVKNNFWASAQYFESISCDVEGECGFFDKLNVGQLSWIGTEKGYVKLYDGTRQIDKKAFNIGFGHSQDTVTLSGCAPGQTVILKLYDKDNNLQEEKTISVR